MSLGVALGDVRLEAVMADEEYFDPASEEFDDSGSDEDQDDVQDVGPGDNGEVDYQELYEKEKAERENLASLIGRQGQELGELRKMIQGSQKSEQEADPYEFFDEDTAKSIDKIVEKRVDERLKAANDKAEKKQLEADFGKVYAEYDVTEDNLTDLAYYASAKGCSLVEAANQLAQKGIIEKREKKRTSGGGVDHLKNAPSGMPKPVGGGGKPGSGRSPVKMTQEEWNNLTDEQRQAHLRKFG